MSGPDKIIISYAVTGAIHTPSMTPHLPITPGGSPYMTAEERAKPAAQWQPEVATPEDAREMLSLKGRDQVNF